MRHRKLQRYVMCMLALMCFAPLPPAHAEKMEFDAFKEYLTRLRDKKATPLDAYIKDKDDNNVVLRDEAKGRPVLLHFWATWCGPCVQELPALAKLAEEFKEKDIFILALSEDFQGIGTVNAFYARTGIKGLEPYADLMTGTSNILEVSSLPTTVLLNKDGKEIDRVVGPVHWGDKEIRAKIEAMIPPKQPEQEEAKEEKAEEKPAEAETEKAAEGVKPEEKPATSGTPVTSGTKE